MDVGNCVAPRDRAERHRRDGERLPQVSRETEGRSVEECGGATDVGHSRRSLARDVGTHGRRAAPGTSDARVGAPRTGSGRSVGDAEAEVSEGEHAERDADPQDAVHERQALHADEQRVLLDGCPRRGQDVEADRIQQPAQRRQVEQVGDGSGPGERREEDRAADEAGADPAAERRARELNGCDDEGGRQRQDAVGTEVGRESGGTENRGFGGGNDQRDQDACRHHEQDQRMEHEGREEAPAQVLGLGDGSGVEERVHARLHVARRGTASHWSGDQDPRRISRSFTKSGPGAASQWT